VSRHTSDSSSLLQDALLKKVQIKTIYAWQRYRENKLPRGQLHTTAVHSMPHNMVSGKSYHHWCQNQQEHNVLYILLIKLSGVFKCKIKGLKHVQKQVHRTQNKLSCNEGTNKKFKLMLTRRRKAYSMPILICNRFHERLRLANIFEAIMCRFPWTQKIETWTVETYVQCWKFRMQLVQVYLNWFQRNSLLKCVLQPEITKKFIKTPILAFKVIQGHWIQWQSTASVRFPISG